MILHIDVRGVEDKETVTGPLKFQTQRKKISYSYFLLGTPLIFFPFSIQDSFRT